MASHWRSSQAPGGVEFGWLEAADDVRFVVDGRRIGLLAGLEHIAAGLVVVLIAAVERFENDDRPGRDRDLPIDDQ